MEVPISFQPQDKTIEVDMGVSVYDAAIKAGIALEAPCGGGGSCGKCRVRILGDAGAPSRADELHLSSEELIEGVRLACQTRVNGPMAVECLNGATTGAAQKILVDTELSLNAWTTPAVRKRHVQLPEPTLEEDGNDFQRLQEALRPALPLAARPCTAGLPMLRALPRKLREASFEGTAVIVDGGLIDFEPGDTEKAAFSVAFDIGTTTLAAVLVDSVTGRECARTSRMNPQTRFGDDVLSRIQMARDSDAGLDTLRSEVITAANEMVRELVSYMRIPPEGVYEATFSGNTTMQCLLTGMDPAALGQVPFVPPAGHAIRCDAREIGLAIHPHARAYVFPVIGGFVGGDTVSGLLVTELAESHNPVLFLDIGTNGEIVIHHADKLVAASCAAGPAFEGACISQGMRAMAGAIEEVIFKEDVELRVIGGVAPTGICGSALLDVAAELLRHGILDPSGLFNLPEAFPDDLAPALRSRVLTKDEGTEFVVATAEESPNGAPVVVTQDDIRQLQLAAAAIRAGIAILLRQTGLTAADLDQFVVAGGFGNYIRPHNAQRIGLLPPELDPERFAFAGNTSLAGARLTAVSLEARERAEELARCTKHVDLSLDLNFQTEYVEAMFFPMQ